MFTDIIIISVIVISIIIGFSKGFASSSLEFLSSIISLIVSYFLSSIIAGFTFDSFFKAEIANSVYNSMQGAAGSVSVSNLVNEYLVSINADFLINIANDLTASLGLSSVEPSLEGATLFTETIVRPFAVMLIAFVVFLVLFVLLRILVKSVAKSLKIVNKIPLIGFANKICGLFSGAVIGVIYAVLITFLLILVGLVVDSPTLTQNLISDSRIVSGTLNFVINFVTA